MRRIRDKIGNAPYGPSTYLPWRWSLGIMFEYDSNKSDANKDKHGVDFETVKALWNDPYRLEIPAKVVDEPRYLVIGKIGGKHWSAIITYRSDSIRIISARRSRKEEVELYERHGI